LAVIVEETIDGIGIRTTNVLEGGVDVLAGQSRDAFQTHLLDCCFCAYSVFLHQHNMNELIMRIDCVEAYVNVASVA